MNTPIPIYIAVEDALGERLARKLLNHGARPFSIGACFGKQGKSYLQRKIKGFNSAARVTPFLVLTDLDSDECAPLLVKSWLPGRTWPNLLFRIAVTEAESWVMADRGGLARYLGVDEKLVPAHPDNVRNAKEKLVEIARRSTKSLLRKALVPADGSSARVGPDYNGCLAVFLENHWDIRRAIKRSPSLRRALDALLSFKPVVRAPREN